MVKRFVFFNNLFARVTANDCEIKYNAVVTLRLRRVLLLCRRVRVTVHTVYYSTSRAERTGTHVERDMEERRERRTGETVSSLHFIRQYNYRCSKSEVIILSCAPVRALAYTRAYVLVIIHRTPAERVHDNGCVPSIITRIVVVV